jgi:signal peptidase I
MADEQRLAKEPWLAVNLSYLVPGLGQFYAHAWGFGVLFLAGVSLLSAVTVWQILSARGSLLVVGLMLLPNLAVKVLSLFHAHARAKRLNSPQAEQMRKQVKDPYLAAFLSQIMPGVGHLYLRRWILSLVFLLVWVIIALAASPVPFGVKIGVLLFLFMPFYSAGVCLLALVMGPASRRPREAAIAGLCVLIAAIPLAAIGSALLARQYVVEGFVVPTGAMAPTICGGDRILAWKWGYASPRRGDIVVYVNPMNRGQNVKRVVAVAGETVEFRKDGVYVNGSELTEGVFGRLPHTSVDRQTYAAPEQPYTVPERTVFVVGDNNSRSFDSRFFGAIPLEDVIARAYKTYWPPWRAGPLE